MDTVLDNPVHDHANIHGPRYVQTSTSHFCMYPYTCVLISEYYYWVLLWYYWVSWAFVRIICYYLVFLNMTEYYYWALLELLVMPDCYYGCSSSTDMFIHMAFAWPLADCVLDHILRSPHPPPLSQKEQ